MTISQMRKQLWERLSDQALVIPILGKHYYLPSLASHMKGTTKNSSGLKIRSLNSNLIKLFLPGYDQGQVTFRS